MKQERDWNLDVVRGFGMIGIVLIHVHSYFVFFHSPEELPQIITLVLSNLSRFSVPVFIFSAGYFSFGKNFFPYWKPKITGVLIPFLVFSLIGYWIKFSEYSLFDLFLRLVTGAIFSPYYFIPLLFQFYALHFLFLQKLPDRFRVYLLPVSFLINMANNLEWIPGSIALGDSYSLVPFTNFIFFYALGFYLQTKGLPSVFKNPAFSVSVHVLSPILVLLNIYSSLTNRLEISNHTIFYSTFLFFLFYSLDWQGTAQKILAAIGKNSLGIFLIHPILIHFMHSWHPHSLGGAYLSIVLTASANVAIPYYLWVYGKKLGFKILPPYSKTDKD